MLNTCFEFLKYIHFFLFAPKRYKIKIATPVWCKRNKPATRRYNTLFTYCKHSWENPVHHLQPAISTLSALSETLVVTIGESMNFLKKIGWFWTPSPLSREEILWISFWKKCKASGKKGINPQHNIKIEAKIFIHKPFLQLKRQQ